MKSLFRAVVMASSRPTVNVRFASTGGGSMASPNVSVDNALRVSTVWACVRLIAETVSTLPLSLYRRDKHGGRVKDRKHSVHDLISSAPNNRMTAVNFWEAVLSSLLFQGNAYIEIMRLGSRVVGLDLLLPHGMRWDEVSNQWIYRNKNTERRLEPHQVMHIPAFSLDGITGLSPIRYGAFVIGGALDADNASRSTFNKGLMPTVAFSVQRKLKEAQREEFRAYVDTLKGSMNAGESPVLEEGVDAKVIGINPADAQLLESRGWSVEEVCRFFRVPPWMVGHTEKTTSWGTGIEQQMIGFLTFTLAPWLERIEQAINRNLLNEQERQTHYAEFTVEGLLRADSAARAEFYAKMTSNGIYTRDDCRVRENLPRRGGNADELTVQMNMTTIDRIGAESTEQAARAALSAWLNEE